MTPGGKRVVLVAAVAANGVIGDGPDIPWRIPGEQARFKALTMGHVLLMGRTTFESIGRPLPGRTTVVLTRSPSWSHEGVLVASSVAEALDLADEAGGDLMVAGGAQVYEALLPHADEQVVTEVPLTPPGDVHYPEIDPAVWDESGREELADYTVVRWTRRVPEPPPDAGATTDVAPAVAHPDADEHSRLGRALITRLADPAVLTPLDDPVLRAVADDVGRLPEPCLFTRMLTALALSAVARAHACAEVAGGSLPSTAELRADQLAATALPPDIVTACFDALDALAAQPDAGDELAPTLAAVHDHGLLGWLAMADVHLAHARMALPWTGHPDLAALLADWFLLEQQALDEQGLTGA